MKKALLSAVILSLAPSLVLALGLGNLKLESSLNEPLRARIELLSATAEEISSAHIGLAGDKEFQSAGIPRPFLLTKLRFSIKESETGPDYVLITSDEPLREPFLNFLLEISWSQGRLYREYTVLLDPPLYVTEAASKKVTPPPVGGLSRQEPSATVSRPISQEGHTVVYAPEYKPAVRTPVYGGGDYGPVARGETLWSIASAMRPDSSVSIQQMMLALQRANPEAFINNNINGLKRGAILKAPEMDDIKSLTMAEAFAQAGLQNSAWEEARQALTGAPPPVRPAGEEMTAPAPAESVREKPAPVTPELEEKPGLRLVAPTAEGTSPGQGGEAAPDQQVLAQELALATESLEALSQENTELKDKVAETEAIISDLNRLIALRENELATLQQQVAQKQGAPQAKQEAAAAAPEPKPAEAQKPEQKPAPKAQAPAPETGIMATLLAVLGGLVDAVRSNLLYIGGALVAVLVIFVGAYLVQRRRQQVAAAVEGSEEVTVFAGVEEITDIGMAAESEAVTEVPGEKAKSAPPAPGASVQEAPQPPPATAAAPAAEEMTAEVADPLEEINVFLAYEQFDQAEEFVKNALEREPENLAYHTKLLEVYYTASNKKAYEEAARVLHDKTKGQGEYWNMALAMWEVLSPNRALFTEPAAGEAAETEVPQAGGGIVNIADESERTGSGGLDFDLDTTGGGAAASDDTMQVAAAEEEAAVLDVTAARDTTGESEVLDVTAAADLEGTGANQETPAADEGGLDFSLNLEEEKPEQQGGDLDIALELPESSADTGTSQDKEADDHSLDFSLDLPEPETDKVPEDSGLELSLDAGEEPAAEVESSGSSDSLLDVTSTAVMDETGAQEGEELSGAGSALLDVTSTASIDDAEAAPSATTDEEVLDLSAEAGLPEGEEVLDISAAGSDIDLESFQEPPAAGSATSEEAELGVSAEEEALDFELGPETTTAPDTAADFDGIDITSDSAAKSKLDLALEPVAESQEEEFEIEMDATMQIPTKRSSLSGSGEEDATVRVPRTSGDAQNDEDEIATQIELARAYIELGNAESAKTILGEVLQAGNADQQKQAQELLGQIS